MIIMCVLSADGSSGIVYKETLNDQLGAPVPRPCVTWLAT